MEVSYCEHKYFDKSSSLLKSKSVGKYIIIFNWNFFIYEEIWSYKTLAAWDFFIVDLKVPICLDEIKSKGKFKQNLQVTLNLTSTFK